MQTLKEKLHVLSTRFVLHTFWTSQHNMCFTDKADSSGMYGEIKQHVGILARRHVYKGHKDTTEYCWSTAQ